MLRKELRSDRGTEPSTPLDLVELLPEEGIWLASRHSRATRRSYWGDVQSFMRAIGIDSLNELRRVDHKAVILWKRLMEEQGLKPSTIRRRLSALSSLFSHLLKHGHVRVNPVRDVERPPVGRREGKTACFSPDEARRILDAPRQDTIMGLRDRAILSVGFQVGARRAEIAALNVRDFLKNRGYWCLRFPRKGGRELTVSVHPQVAERILCYLEASGRTGNGDEPLFLPVGKSWRNQNERRHISPDTVDRILRKYARQIGLLRGFSAHSMRATFITRALENGASLEDVQQAVGHEDPSTTRLYDRRRMNPERSASFYANY
ncbi:MAG: tyrosine-type recombinase/integrase [Candidatus Methanosuratincola sp.]|jgi:site-specific recombinase XerD